MIAGAWQAFVEEKLKELKETAGPQVTVANVLANPVSNQALFQEFMKGQPPTAFYQALNNDFFWHAGEYSLHLRVSSSRPDRDFDKRWLFTVQKKDEDSLRLNVIGVIEAAIGRQPTYRFAYAPYKLDEKPRLPKSAV